ncbi:MAG: complex I subunit 5 family protein [Verrucomicrobia bacterium]|nr:complex I subunit 5 family protein [Verrucomicrobiota bacterium]
MGGRTWPGTPTETVFFLFYLLAMAGNFGLILAFDAPVFYFCFALMSFASYGLVIHNGDTEALRAGRIYIYLVVLGEVLLFAALVTIVGATGSTRLPVAADAPLSPLTFGLAVAGFGIKAGLLPLHVWLPLAHPVAPTPASAVLSGAMIKAGVIGWLRFLPWGQAPQPAWGSLLLMLGMAGALFGVVVGLTQRNPKTVLAYSSISQMGLIMSALGAGWVAPEHWPAAQTALLLYALHHGLAKGALFLGVGVAQATGARGRTWTGAGLLLPALALAGAPWTSGAVAKSALQAAVDAMPGAWAESLAVLLPVAAVGTTLLMARFLVLVWPRDSGRGHLTAGMYLPWLGLLGAVALASYVWPPAVGIEGGSFDSSKAWSSTWPVLAGGLVGWVAWKWGARGRASRRFLPATCWPWGSEPAIHCARTCPAGAWAVCGRGPLAEGLRRFDGQQAASRRPCLGAAAGTVCSAGRWPGESSCF